MAKTLRVIDIIDGTTVDGPGFRTSVYLAGCDHGCPGCHNPQSWDHAAGRDMSVDEVMSIIEDADFPVTLSGGDPIYQHEAVTELCRRLKQSGRNIWLYTGFCIETLYGKEELSELLGLVDVVVDGPYVAAERDTSLLFRGSVNQRLIDMRRSTPSEIALWEPEW